VTSTTQISGRIWLFPEANIDTDLIMPGATFRLPIEEQLKLVFSANRPDWHAMVQSGDIIVAGPNFGTGSARPAPLLFRKLGVSAIVAESFSDLFMRNCVNYAMPALVCPSVCSAVVEGDIVDLDIDLGALRVRRTGQELSGVRTPKMLLEIVAAGGLMARLTSQGYIS
jgi:3-isopropylmalate/(R)-2-methylmalate dehydratase small subunit